MYTDCVQSIYACVLSTKYNIMPMLFISFSVKGDHVHILHVPNSSVIFSAFHYEHEVTACYG